MTQRTDDPLERLRAADPAAGDRPSPADLARIEARLAREGKRRSASRRGMRWGRLAPGLGALAVATSLALVVALTGGAPGGPAPASASVLQQFAARAEAAVPGPQTPDSWGYTKALRSSPHLQRDYLAVETTIVEIWQRADGKGHIRVTPTGDPLTFPTPEDEAAWRAAGRPAFPSPRIDGPLSERHGPRALTVAGQPIGLSWREVRDLPTRPRDLRTALGGDDAEAGRQAVALLALPLVTPAQRGGLLRMLDGLATVADRGEVTDPTGRTGRGLELAGGGSWRTLLVLDPATGALLAQRDTTLDDPGGGAATRRVDLWTVHLVAGIAARAGVEPGG